MEDEAKRRKETPYTPKLLYLRPSSPPPGPVPPVWYVKARLERELAE